MSLPHEAAISSLHVDLAIPSVATGLAKASFDAAEYGDEYISLNMGDQVLFLEAPSGLRTDDEWAYGRVAGGATGWFPSSYVNPVCTSKKGNVVALSQPDLVQQAYEQSTIPARRLMRCAHSLCNFIVHSDVCLRGYCCKTCHYSEWFDGTVRPQHGRLCEKQVAPQGTERADHIPPDNPWWCFSSECSERALKRRRTTASAHLLEATHAFNVEDWGTEYLSLQPGDRILPCEAPPCDGARDGWSFGQVTRRGWFPDSHAASVVLENADG